MADKVLSTCPLDEIDVSDPLLFERGEHHEWFKRLREEDPVHYCPESMFGPYWSITTMKDVMAVDRDHETFSASPWGIIGDPPEGANSSAFIFLDPPEHEPLRMSVQPVVAPQNLREMEGVIRGRVIEILDGLPVGKPFNWVELVSIELTSQILAILMGYPIERRKELIDMTESVSGSLGQEESAEDKEKRLSLMQKTMSTFREIWEQRLKQPPSYDLISLLQQSEATKDMIDDEETFIMNLLLLIIGGNDTTRNSISGGVLALNENPKEYEKLRNNLALIPGMVSEIIRWQTPLMHHRRTATRDTEFGGKTH